MINADNYKPVPDVECLRYKGTTENSDIKIFVSHRIDFDSEIIDNSLYIPVRCGAAYDKRKSISMLGDDTGDNISEKRLSYNEFTVMYWAWKNVKADYYGLCHYRRYLIFSTEKFPVDYNFNVIEEFINENAVQKFGLTEKTMRKKIEEHDFICWHPVDVSLLAGKFKSVKDQYCSSANFLLKKDFELMEKIIEEKHPKYAPAAKKYFYGTMAYFCNLFIMKKHLFDEYCNFLFGILEELSKSIDVSNYCEQGFRTVAYLGERLLGVYITYLIDGYPKLKYKCVQTVVFEKPQRQVIHIATKREAVVILLLTRNGFVPQTAVMLQSLVSHSNKNRCYEIYAFGTDVSPENEEALRNIVEVNNNCLFKYINVSQFFAHKNLYTKDHVHIETFYRFVALKLFSQTEKVLYLDADIIVNTDVAELFDIDISNKYLAAVKDIDMAGQVGVNGNSKDYLREQIGLLDPYQYFQAGVMLFNITEMRKHCDMDYLVNLISEADWRYLDQDIMNHVFKDKICYLPQSWNVMMNWKSDVDCRMNSIRNAPYTLYNEYLKARESPKIVHYAGYQKPWNNPSCDFSTYFWYYARKVPFYEILLQGLYMQIINQYQSSWNNNQRLIEECRIRINSIEQARATAFPRRTLLWRLLRKVYRYFKK